MVAPNELVSKFHLMNNNYISSHNEKVDFFAVGLLTI
tara:strand:- start:2404 stop:2514 length:111 start_codon:yes stop_codon:yes gene_type:complete